MSGLRANELRHLTWDHLDVEQGGLRLEAEWTKGRRAAFQPLPGRLVKRLVAFYDSGIVPQAYGRFLRNVVFPPKALLYVPQNPAREFYRDLKTAGIAKKTAEGKIDFHGLRTSYVSLCIESGASVKEVQTLARHTDPRITMNSYARARDERLSEITEKVANRVLSAETGAPVVHATTVGVINENAKPLLVQGLSETEKYWRRGESNPIRCEKKELQNNSNSATESCAGPFQGILAEQNEAVLVHSNDSSERQTGAHLVHGVTETPQDPDLAQVVTAWAHLPEHLKHTILTLIRATADLADHV